MKEKPTVPKARQWKLEQRRQQIATYLEKHPQATFEELVEAGAVQVSKTRTEVCKKQTANIVGQLLETGHVQATISAVKQPV